MSLSRQFATFTHALTYYALPEAVRDRAKGVLLQALCSALLAHDMPATKQALAIMADEDPPGPATTLGHGAKLSKAGAAFVNAEMILAGGKWDTFRMLTQKDLCVLALHCSKQLAGLPATCAGACSCSRTK